MGLYALDFWLSGVYVYILIEGGEGGNEGRGLLSVLEVRECGGYTGLTG